MTDTNLIRPVININGTSAGELTEGRQTAYRRIALLIEDLKAITPNGRDYPSDKGSLQIDRDIHFARLNALRVLQHDLMSEALLIQHQTKETLK